MRTGFSFQAKALGKVLFEQVCRQLNLLEADYFGLEYSESTNANVKVNVSLIFFSFTSFQNEENEILQPTLLTRLCLMHFVVLVRLGKTNKSTSWPIARRTYI